MAFQPHSVVNCLPQIQSHSSGLHHTLDYWAGHQIARVTQTPCSGVYVMDATWYKGLSLTSLSNKSTHEYYKTRRLCVRELFEASDRSSILPLQYIPFLTNQMTSKSCVTMVEGHRTVKAKVASCTCRKLTMEHWVVQIQRHWHSRHSLVPCISLQPLGPQIQVERKMMFELYALDDAENWVDAGQTEIAS